jgi:hypothetical protein
MVELHEEVEPLGIARAAGAASGRACTCCRADALRQPTVLKPAFSRSEVVEAFRYSDIALLGPTSGVGFCQPQGGFLLTPITDRTESAQPACCATSTLTVTRDATREYAGGSNDLQRRARPEARHDS